MVLTESHNILLGTKAIDFKLPDQVSGQELDLSSCSGDKATVIIFMCNHCPYVIHIIDDFVKIIQEFATQEVKCIAINSNDVIHYPEDSPAKMKIFAKQHNFIFPYLFDETQAIAKKYQAQCTPDIYIYDHDLTLTYHGRFDESSPGNGKNPTGNDMRSAIENTVAKQKIIATQNPSIGCNIKWLS